MKNTVQGLDSSCCAACNPEMPVERLSYAQGSCDRLEISCRFDECRLAVTEEITEIAHMAFRGSKFSSGQEADQDRCCSWLLHGENAC